MFFVGCIYVFILHRNRNPTYIFDCQFFCSQKMTLMVRLTNISSLIRKAKKGPKYGIMSGCAFIRRRNLLRYLLLFTYLSIDDCLLLIKNLTPTNARVGNFLFEKSHLVGAHQFQLPLQFGLGVFNGTAICECFSYTGSCRMHSFG